NRGDRIWTCDLLVPNQLVQTSQWFVVFAAFTIATMHLRIVGGSFSHAAVTSARSVGNSDCEAYLGRNQINCPALVVRLEVNVVLHGGGNIAMPRQFHEDFGANLLLGE